MSESTFTLVLGILSTPTAKPPCWPTSPTLLARPLLSQTTSSRPSVKVPGLLANHALGWPCSWLTVLSTCGLRSCAISWALPLLGKISIWRVRDFSCVPGTQVPKAKYSFPQTSSQEYGWDVEDEVRSARAVCIWKHIAVVTAVRLLGSQAKHRPNASTTWHYRNHSVHGIALEAEGKRGSLLARSQRQPVVARYSWILRHLTRSVQEQEKMGGASAQAKP